MINNLVWGFRLFMDLVLFVFSFRDQERPHANLVTGRAQYISSKATFAMVVYLGVGYSEKITGLDTFRVQPDFAKYKLSKYLKWLK